jgi:surface protein
MRLNKLVPSARNKSIRDSADTSIANIGELNIIIDTLNALLDRIRKKRLSLNEATEGFADKDAFQFTVKTDNAGSTNTNQFKLTLTEGFDYLIEVDWGDGSKDVIKTFDSPLLLHTYATPGTYTIKIIGDGDSIFFTDNPAKVLEVQNWGMFYAQPYNFSLCSNLTITATDLPYLSGDISGLFDRCTSLTGVANIDDWDLSKVTDISFMFTGCTIFNDYIGSWDISNVTTLKYTFNNCRLFDQDISGWDTSNVTSMDTTFGNCYVFNQPIGSWNTSKVLSTYAMFYEARLFNQPLNDWDMSNVRMPKRMFFYARAFNQPLDKWNTRNFVDITYMFLRAYQFNDPSINQWDTRNVRIAQQPFRDCPFNQPLDNWDVRNLRDATLMFYDCEFNQPIGNWKFENLRDLNATFYQCRRFNQDVGNWDLTSINRKGEGLNDTFIFAYDFNNGGSDSINNWDVKGIRKIQETFRGATSFNQPLDKWDVSETTNLSLLFDGATVFNQDISGWNTGSCVQMSRMFQGAAAFNQPIGKWDVSKVTNMDSMFRNALVFNQDLSSWDTSSVTSMSSMFSGAILFNQDISNWDVSNVANFSTFMTGTTVDAAYIDNMFNKWSQQDLVSGLTLDLGTNQYTDAGESGRQKLIDDFGWTIVDGGKIV